MSPILVKISNMNTLGDRLHQETLVNSANYSVSYPERERKSEIWQKLQQGASSVQQSHVNVLK